ncbi:MULTISPECIES: DMP19 family protein [unclassified Microcoleus]|uniref:DMP19 family protein n=1 Tax=unclassified Microcoleus TaxID=2642155 RepID=UPI002FD34F90
MSDDILGSKDAVVLSAESMNSDDIRATIQSNIDFVNALFEELLNLSEISHDALLSYYVDYYLGQVNNGGFAQFVYNTRWQPAVIALVKEGLGQIGATQHTDLFAKGEALVTARKTKLASFFSSGLFGENAERDRLNGINEDFYSIAQEESLERLNANWLKARPGLIVVAEDRIQQEVTRRALSISDREARLAQARAAEPRYIKLIRALCHAAGHKLERVTAGDTMNEYGGQRILAWHFITDKGHHFMVEADGKAMMFSGKSKEQIAELVVV